MTLLLLAALVGILGISLMTTATSRLVIQQVRLTRAADLAALAAAAQLGDPRGCAMAQEVARRNGAVLVGCVWRDLNVRIDVRGEVYSWQRAHAWAGVGLPE